MNESSLFAVLTSRAEVLLPFLLYLILTMAVALWAQRRSAHVTATASAEKSHSFLMEYFLGSRSMGGFVLAMAIMCSYTSASSFIGGPGVAYTLGLGWVLLSMIQVPTTFLTLGVLGKRFAIIARRTGSVTIADMLFARYHSNAVVILCSVAMLIFFMAAMLAQFIGGARVFQVVTGLSYEAGLLLFGLGVILYTAVGGFRAVILTDAIQGVMMMAAAVVVLWAVLDAGGGMEASMNTLAAHDPALLTPQGPANAIPAPMLFSFWILVGLGILGLPQTAQKCFAYKDARSMHRAMLVGTLVIGFLMLCLHLAGALGRAILPDLTVGDLVMPTLTLELLPPVWAGLFMAGPLAAIMSTVDTMLLLVSAALVKDLYIRFRHANDPASLSPRTLSRISLWSTLITGLLVFIAALQPPDLLVWINLFAFGGLEAVFLWPIILGLYWKKANAAGAVCGILAGLVLFMGLSILKPAMGGIHPIVPTLAISGLLFALVSRCTPPPPQAVIQEFWED